MDIAYDLVYANAQMEDIGILLDYTLDLAVGTDENDFELTVDATKHVCQAGYYIYIEGTEYGGVVDTIRVRTGEKEVTYMGRTWQGILASKVLEPDAGEDYLAVSGEANSVIGDLLKRMGLSGLFDASAEASGLEVRNYKMNRYINGYAGLAKMLEAAGGKLKFVFRDQKVILWAASAVDCSKDDQFDSDLVEMEVEKGFHPINHAVCLGRGELAEREVIHLYADREGRISSEQSLAGMDEITAVYENTSAESTEELRQGGIELLEEAQAASSKISMSFGSGDAAYDIGDTIGARERTTGIAASEKISKKIVSISRGSIEIEYKVGE